MLKKLAAPTELFEARSAMLDVFELTAVNSSGMRIIISFNIIMKLFTLNDK